MFLQTFLTAYAIALGIVCAAATMVLAAALPYWIYMNIKERMGNQVAIRAIEQEDNWPYEKKEWPK